MNSRMFNKPTPPTLVCLSIPSHMCWLRRWFVHTHTHPLGCSGFSKGDKLLVWALATQLKLSLTNDCVCGEEKCVWMAIPVKGCHYESIVLSIVSDSFWTSLTREQLPCSWNSSLIQYRVWVFRVQKRELIPHPNRYPRGVIMTGDNPQAKCASRCVCVLMR